MATRAMIGFIDPETKKLISTYNHYDGYPENLGKGLENFYNEDESAKEIASIGYISGMDGDTGQYDSKYQKPPQINSLPDNFEDAMGVVADQMSSLGASYGYIWNSFDKEWAVIKQEGYNKNVEQLMLALDSLSPEFGASPNQEIDEEELNEYNKRQWQHRAGIIK